MRIIFKLLKAVSGVYTEGDIFISGGCPLGADRFSEFISEDAQIPMVIFYPNMKPYANVAKQRWMFTKANYERNTLVAHNSDIIFALVAPDRKGGTEDTIEKFEKIYPNKSYHSVVSCLHDRLISK